MMETGVNIGDALNLMRGNNNGFGSNGLLDILLIIVLIGCGGFGGGWGGNNALNNALTRAELYDSQQLQTIAYNQTQAMRDDCQSTATLSNQITNANYDQLINSNNNNNAVISGITQLGYNTQNCCCEIGSKIDALSYNMAREAYETRQAISASTQAIIDNNTQRYISQLEHERDGYANQLSQSVQTNTITNNVTNNVLSALRNGNGYYCVA